MENEKKFMQQHEVIVILKRIKETLEYADKYLRMHQDYYRGLYNKNKIVKYGNVLNDDSVCILLKAHSDNEFEYIIMNDPAIDKLFEIANVIPFLCVGHT